MNKARVLLILGIWVAFLPYLGFPYYLKSLLFVATGFGLIYISFVLYKEAKISGGKDKVFDNFRENIDYNNHE